MDANIEKAVQSVREWNGMDRASASRSAREATMKGMCNRVPVRAAHLAARVISVMVRIQRDRIPPHQAMKFYVDALWCDGPPDYQGISVKALERGEFETTWRILARGRDVNYRAQLAYQTALFCRNWLLSGRSVKRLADLAKYLSNY